MFQTYDAIQYFDSSIWFLNSSSRAIEAKIHKEDSCWIYFIKEAGHDISSHTHPGMFNFFPSDYWKMIDMLKVKMKMAGAVIIYNTDFCKMKILKWAFLCALTRDCIAPHGSMKGCGKPNWYMYDQTRYDPKWEMGFLQESRMVDANKTVLPKPVIYQTCHRFDQAMLSILWTNQMNYSEFETEVTRMDFCCD